MLSGTTLARGEDWAGEGEGWTQAHWPSGEHRSWAGTSEVSRIKARDPGLREPVMERELPWKGAVR